MKLRSIAYLGENGPFLEAFLSSKLKTVCLYTFSV